MTRVNLGNAVPKAYQGVLELDKIAKEAAANAGLTDGFVHLLELRASQINECAFCVRMHTRDALAAGESTDRIALVAAWLESGYFDEKERAALVLIEAVTLISEGQVPDDVYEEAAAMLSDAEIAAVGWLGVVINAWNRIAISSRYAVWPERT